MSEELLPRRISEVVGPLIGRPWHLMAAGPDAWDCWTLLVHVQRELFGRDIVLEAAELASCPRDIIDAVRGSSLQRSWQPVDTPRDGDVVVMSRHANPIHVGTWLTVDGSPGVLHCLANGGVQFQTLPELRSAWHRIEFRRDCGPAIEQLTDMPAPVPQGAAIVVVNDPLRPLEGAVVFETEPGLSPVEALERVPGLPAAYWICIDAEPLLRKHPETGENEWAARRIREGQTLWVLPPLPEGDGFVGILASVAMVAAAIAAPYAVAALGIGALGTTAASLTLAGKILAAGLAIGANLLIGQLIPTPPGAPQLKPPSPTYALAPPGNQRRPGSPIPRIYGTVRRQPDLLAVPWAEFRQDEQYYHVLLCLGIGEYRLNSFGIEDTEVWSISGGFSGALTDIEYEHVPPGQRVRLFPTSVRVSAEAAGQELVPASGGVISYIGPFTACASNETTEAIDLDFAFPAGLFILVSGKLRAAQVQITAEARQIDSAGSPIGGWDYAETYTTEFASAEPHRFTRTLEVPEGRYEVRVGRITDPVAVDPGEQDTVNWLGMRARLLDQATSYDDVSVLALRIRASETSSQASLLWYVDTTAILPRYDNSGTLITEPTEQIDAAVLDILRSSYGLSLGDSQIDLDKLKALANTWRGRGDVCCLAVDGEIGCWEALDMALAPGRARAQFIGSTVTFVRDELQTLPRQLVTQADMVRGSFQVERRHLRREAPTSVTVRFRDRLGRQRLITCTPPGVAEERPAIIDRYGIVDYSHAWREGMYLATANRLRRRYASWRMREAGRALTRGNLLGIAHPRPDYGRPARVRANLWPVLDLSAPHDLAPADAALMAIQTPAGDYWGPVKVSPVDDRSVLVDETDFAQVLIDMGNDDPRTWLTDLAADREATRVAIGKVGIDVQQMLAVDMRPQADGTVDVVAMQDHPDVHAADIGVPPPDPYDTPISLPAGVEPTSLYPYNGTEGTAVTVWTGVEISFPGQGLLLVSGPYIAGANRYTAQLSIDGGVSWQQFTSELDPLIALTPPNEQNILVRYAARSARWQPTTEAVVNAYFTP